MSILFDAIRRARGGSSRWSQTLGAPASTPASDRSKAALLWLLCALLAAVATGLAVYVVLIHARADQPAVLHAPVALDVHSQAHSEAASAPISATRRRSPIVARQPGKADSAPAPGQAARLRQAQGEGQAARPATTLNPSALALNGHDSAHADRQAVAVGASGAAAPQPVSLAQVPAGVRREFPALRVVAHVWNPEPALRFIVAAGRRLRAGDEIVDGVRLLEITRAGEIVSFRGYRISLP